MILGIDLGISTTKFALIDGNSEAVFHEMKPEPMTIEKLEWYIDTMMILGRYKIDTIAVTGVGARKIGDTLYKRPVIHVDEFEANSLSAQTFIDKDRFIVVSMGTGTSFVLSEHGTYTHIGGSALGGGTLLGLMNLLMPGMMFYEFRELAKEGNLANIDLQIKDVSPVELPNLPMDTTAANFGKVKDEPAKADLAAGLVNLVLQNVGVMANLAGKGRNIDTFCFIGLMCTLPKSREIFDRLEKLYGIHILVPAHPETFTALGAALKTRQLEQGCKNQGETDTVSSERHASHRWRVRL